eukprot:5294356-Heterocapsa_arctica.AAC.1
MEQIPKSSVFAVTAILRGSGIRSFPDSIEDMLKFHYFRFLLLALLSSPLLPASLLVSNEDLQM